MILRAVTVARWKYRIKSNLLPDLFYRKFCNTKHMLWAKAWLQRRVLDNGKRLIASSFSCYVIELGPGCKLRAICWLYPSCICLWIITKLITMSRRIISKAIHSQGSSFSSLALLRFFFFAVLILRSRFN